MSTTNRTLGRSATILVPSNSSMRAHRKVPSEDPPCRRSAMPAVTVSSVLTLPRVPTPDATLALPRPVRSITTSTHGFEGEGFPVRRAFAGVDLATLDPFVHLDQMGEVEYAPGEPKGTAWHPHRGFE